MGRKVEAVLSELMPESRSAHFNRTRKPWKFSARLLRTTGRVPTCRLGTYGYADASRILRNQAGNPTGAHVCFAVRRAAIELMTDSSGGRELSAPTPSHHPGTPGGPLLNECREVKDVMRQPFHQDRHSSQGRSNQPRRPFELAASSRYHPSRHCPAGKA